MKQLDVHTATHDYVITIDEGLLPQLENLLGADYSAIFVITDDQVAPLYLENVLKGLPEQKTYHAIIPSGERSKSIDMFYTLQTEMIQLQLDRHSVIIALGGGVVGDLAGFVAATFMRGIDYVQVPTTILAHDSSVGGKVAINHELGKNMIGHFYPPKAVIYDVATLASLPFKEIRSGYAELVKEAYISDSAFLQQLLSMHLQPLNRDALKDHLYEGMHIKAEIVEKDEREANIRMFLNFGHTLAHAIETELGYTKVAHGEAVAIGMLFALHLSEQTYEKDLHYTSYFAWMLRNEYPVSLFDINPKALLNHMKRDKKATSQQIKMVLLKEIGQPEIVNLTDEQILQALQRFEMELNNR